jgi:metallo-beta-lactamase family protein
MHIQFCGANRTVTGSCHLLHVNGLRIFLDMGLYQGPRDEARRLNQYLPDHARTADAIVLSHGHLDHCGKLPVVVREGYAGPIYCTPATAEVARIVLEDSAEIQLEDADYINRRSRQPGQAPVQPLYRPSDIPHVLKLFKRVEYNRTIDLGKGVRFTFHDAGHILGSAYVLLQWDVPAATPGQPTTRSLLFTADVGRYNTPILNDPAPIPVLPDLVLTESTYGDKTHAPMDGVEQQFLDAVQFCVKNRSRLLIPAFAVGRTQTVLWYIQKFIHENKIPTIPVFVDSPMGVQVSRIHEDFPQYFDKQTTAMIAGKDLFGLTRITFATSMEQSKAINTVTGPCVIIASSPTCEFGRILHHLKFSMERPNDLLIFVGWTPPNTLGRRLQDGQNRARIFDRWYDVRCQIRTIHGLSAHADGDELIRFLTPTLRPQTTFFVVHGEAGVADTFAQRLSKSGVHRIGVPAMETVTFQTPH